MLCSRGSVMALALYGNYSLVFAARPPQDKSIVMASTKHAQESKDTAVY